MAGLPAQMIADKLQSYPPIVFPHFLWKVVVLPMNLAEGTDFFFNCSQNCLNLANLNGFRVIATWMLTNSTAAFSESAFAGLD